MKDLNEIKDLALESLIQEREDQEHQWNDFDAIQRIFRTWRGWYLKRTQPHSYIRLMCRKPDHEHWKTVRSTWNCRLQCFRGDDLVCDMRITADAYELF